jgi:hypothetical protein
MTKFINPRTWNVGELVTKAIMDAHVRDQLNALWPYTATGQIALSSASDELTKLEASGNGDKTIRSNGSIFVLEDDAKELIVTLNTDTALVAGDDLFRFPIPLVLDGYSFSDVRMFRKSGSGTPLVQLNNDTTGNDILSTRVSPGTPGTINSTYKTVSAYDIIAVDVDDAGTSSLHCSLLLRFKKY